MARFEAFEEGVEVNGQTVRSMLADVGEFSSVFEKRMTETLGEHGIEDPRPDERYSQQAYLDAFGEIADSIGSRTLANIGKKLPENADWPPGIDSVSGGLDSIDAEPSGKHRFSLSEERIYRVSC